jgi:hypothetical protein
LRDSAYPGFFTVNRFAIDGDNQVSSDSEFDVADIDDLGSASDPGGFFGGTAYDVLYEEAASAGKIEALDIRAFVPGFMWGGGGGVA